MTRFFTNATFFNDVIVRVRVRIIVLVKVRVMVGAGDGFKVLRNVALRKVICEKS